MKGVPLLNLDKLKSLNEEERIPEATRNENKSASPEKVEQNPNDEFSPLEEFRVSQPPHQRNRSIIETSTKPMTKGGSNLLIDVDLNPFGELTGADD